MAIPPPLHHPESLTSTPSSAQTAAGRRATKTSGSKSDLPTSGTSGDAEYDDNSDDLSLGSQETPNAGTDLPDRIRRAASRMLPGGSPLGAARHGFTGSFQFFPYDDTIPPPSADDIRLTQNSYWCYVGPLLDPDPATLPQALRDWLHRAVEGDLLPHLLPFLTFSNRFLRQRGIDHHWITIRATKPSTEFDRPRWHTDDLFFADLARTRRGPPRQTDWKMCATLRGPSTLFVPAERQAEARERQAAAQARCATPHVCTAMRCLACGATSDAVRARLEAELGPMGRVQPRPGECAAFRIGAGKGAVHSEPAISGCDRVFVNLIPGTREELSSKLVEVGMEFPRTWSVFWTSGREVNDEIVCAS